MLFTGLAPTSRLFARMLALAGAPGPYVWLHHDRKLVVGGGTGMPRVVVVCSRANSHRRVLHRQIPGVHIEVPL